MIRLVNSVFTLFRLLPASVSKIIAGRRAELPIVAVSVSEKKRRGIWKKRSIYDKFSNRMRSHKRSATTLMLAVLVCLSALATLSCNIAAVPGRFTYIVKYEVTTNTVAPGSVIVDIAYTDGTPAVPTTGNASPTIDAATPWSFELLTAFSYDEGNFYPAITVDENTLTLTSGETVTAKIIWKDYRVDFQEQVLEMDTVSGSAAVESVILTGPEIPVP